MNSLRLLFVLGLASVLASGLAFVAGCGDGFSAGSSDSGSADSTTDQQGGDDGGNGDDGTQGGDDGGHDGQARDGDSSIPPGDGSGGADGISGDAIGKDGGNCPITVIGPGCFDEAGSAVCVDFKLPGFAPFCYPESNPSACTNQSILCASGAQCPSGVNPVCCAAVASAGPAAQCSASVQIGLNPITSCQMTAAACTGLGGRVACATSAECPPASPRCVEANGLPAHPDAGPPTPLFGICVP